MGSVTAAAAPRELGRALGLPHPVGRRGLGGRAPVLGRGREAWWSVPLAVVIGIPLYSNAAGIIPIVQALPGKGAALGTVLTFMMSVIVLSLPEMAILRKVLTVRLIVVFVAVVGAEILVVGYLFNFVL